MMIITEGYAWGFMVGLMAGAVVFSYRSWKRAELDLYRVRRIDEEVTTFMEIRKDDIARYLAASLAKGIDADHTAKEVAEKVRAWGLRESSG